MKRYLDAPLKIWLGFSLSLLLSIGGAASFAATEVSEKTPQQVTDEMLKSFMAGMTYTPQAMPMPTEAEIQASIQEMALMAPAAPEIDEAADEPAETVKPKTTAKKENSAPKVLNFLQPVVDAFISSHFGIRWGRMHDGVDLAANAGSPIKAAESGKITFSGWKGGYGNFVTIDHGGGYATRYGHASKLLVRKGQTVKRGQIIALVGSTGHSTGPHLHFEVVKKGKFQNPLAYLNRVLNLAQAQ